VAEGYRGHSRLLSFPKVSKGSFAAKKLSAFFGHMLAEYGEIFGALFDDNLSRFVLGVATVVFRRRSYSHGHRNCQDDRIHNFWHFYYSRLLLEESNENRR
jgi:hypothetical protein